MPLFCNSKQIWRYLSISLTVVSRYACTFVILFSLNVLIYVADISAVCELCLCVCVGGVGGGVHYANRGRASFYTKSHVTASGHTGNKLYHIGVGLGGVEI